MIVGGEEKDLNLPNSVHICHLEVDLMVHGLHRGQSCALVPLGSKGHAGADGLSGLDLTLSQEGGVINPGIGAFRAHLTQLFHQRLADAADSQFGVRDVVELPIGGAPCRPVQVQFFMVKIIHSLLGDALVLGKAGGGIVPPLQLAGFGGKQRPAPLPFHGADEGLTAQIFADAVDEPGGQHHRVPAAVRQLHQIGMTYVADGAAVAHVAMGDQGIGGIILVGAEDVLAPGDGLGVEVFRATLGDHQVVVLADVVDVGGFRGSRTGKGTTVDGNRLADDPEVFDVIGCHPNTLADAAGLVWPALGGSHDVALAVVVKEDGCVDAGHVGQPMGLGPRASRVFRGDDEVTPVGVIQVDDVEGSIMVDSNILTNRSFTTEANATLFPLENV